VQYRESERERERERESAVPFKKLQITVTLKLDENKMKFLIKIHVDLGDFISRFEIFRLDFNLQPLLKAFKNLARQTRKAPQRAGIMSN